MRPVINKENDRHSGHDSVNVTAAIADILLVEDDAELATQTCVALQAAGFATRHASTLASATSAVANKTPALLIIDRMLPDGDGLDFLRALKKSDFNSPTMVLSALGEVNDRVEGLNDGADDYLVKPFDFSELSARVSALLRRTSPQRLTEEISIGDLNIDLMSRSATRNGVSLNLQPREFKLLAFLAEHGGDVVTKNMLLKEVWGLDFDPQTNVVEVHMSRLRAKLDRGYPRKLLHTVRGAGYSLRGG